MLQEEVVSLGTLLNRSRSSVLIPIHTQAILEISVCGACDLMLCGGIGAYGVQNEKSI